MNTHKTQLLQPEHHQKVKKMTAGEIFTSVVQSAGNYRKLPAAALLFLSVTLYGAGAVTGKEGFSGTIGGGVRSQPVLTGASVYKYEPIPVVSLLYTFKFLTVYAGTVDGIGATAIEKNTGLFLSNAVDLGEPRTCGDIRKGGYGDDVPEITSPISLNSSAGITSANHELFIMLRYLPVNVKREGEGAQSYHGVLYDVRTKSTWMFFERLMLQNEFALSLMNPDYRHAYFSTKSTSREGSSFAPEAEAYQIWAQQQLLYFLLPGTAGGISVKESYLFGSAGASPLCKSALQLETTILLVYNF